MESIELGGNIVLAGFDLDHGRMIVVKKMVGYYARAMAEKSTAFRRLSVSHEQGRITVQVESHKGMSESSDQGKNIFFSLDKALSTALQGLE